MAKVEKKNFMVVSAWDCNTILKLSYCTLSGALAVWQLTGRHCS
jgi:hypothetical protein